MPQLPEVEILHRDLEREIVGRRIKEAEVRPRADAMKIVRRHGRRKEFSDLLAGAKVERAVRRGKYILLELDNDHVLVLDLVPGGQVAKTSASDELASHTHIVISFTIGGQLRVSDPTKGAEVFVVPKAEIDEIPELKLESIDPLEGPMAWQQLSGRLDEHDRTLRQLLLDEAFVCGLGEIYADEVLWTAGLRPERPANKLTSQDVRRLYRALVEVVQDAVKARGASVGADPFRDLQGNPGQYQLELKVYERDGESCRRCRATVVLEDGVYFCPQCQA